MVKPATIKTVLTLALSKGWSIHQIDINNAFLNGDLTEEVYMSQPPGFIHGEGSLVCKLHKALYGLKQTLKAWFSKLHHNLLTFGFLSAKYDSSLFVKQTPQYTLLILVYVDDIILTSNSSAAIDELISSLHAIFPLKYLGSLNFFSGDPSALYY